MKYLRMEIKMAEERLLDGKKVLLVDDEPDVLGTLEDLWLNAPILKPPKITWRPNISTWRF